MEQIKAVTVTFLVCLWFSVGTCSESDPLIKMTLPSNGDSLYSTNLYKVQNITEPEWDSLVMMSDLPVLVMFTSNECERCRIMDLILDKLDSTYTGRFRFYTIDFDKAPIIAERYYVPELPTTIIFFHGYVEGKVIGFNPAKVMRLVDEYAN